MQHWFELSVDVSPEDAELVGSFLFDEGCLGLEDESREGVTRLKAYFDREPPATALRAFLAELPASGASSIPRSTPTVRPIDDQDWANSWRDHFAPLAIGDRFFVCPPWVQERPADRHVIEIDPGMAFGTGHHATTRMCLELCDAALAQRPARAAVDLGSGSGILAIGLALLEVPRVLAVEIDPIAREASVANAQCNGVAAAIETLNDLSEVAEPVDLIVANLFTNLLVELAPRIVSGLLPGGRFICSGFIESDADRVERALTGAGLRLRDRRGHEEWVAMLLDKD